MARKKKWPPSILPHKPSGRDRVRIDGVDHWLGPSGSDEAKEAYRRLVFERQPGAPPACGPTVREAVAYWEEHDAARLDERERRQYRRALLVLLRVCGGEPAASFDSSRLEDVRAAMTSASWMNEKDRAYFARWKREPRWSARVANRQVGRIRTVWRFLERKKQVPRGSTGELALLAGIPETDRRVRQRPRTRPATREDVEAVCTRIRSAATKAMLRVQWLTGMRSGELRAMRGSEVDRSAEVWVYRPRTHKNAWRGQERAVPIGPQAQGVLGPLLRAAGDGLVFRTQRGTAYTAQRYSLAAKLAAAKVGRPWFRPYCCRHGAKKRITAELGLDAARAVLGQASLGTTNSYAEGIDLVTAVAAAEKCG